MRRVKPFGGQLVNMQDKICRNENCYQNVLLSISICLAFFLHQKPFTESCTLQGVLDTISDVHVFRSQVNFSSLKHSSGIFTNLL